MAWRSDSLHEKRSQVQWGNNILQKEETDNWVTKKKKKRVRVRAIYIHL